MKKTLILLLLTTVTFFSQIESRKEVSFPDFGGYKTLKCDFHMHTVFSDGVVWPDIRVVEAWREGLDVISITDHIEYLPHKEDMNIKFNRSYELALGKSKELDILLIRGAEITRSMPPGHLNAMFLKDADKLDTENWYDAVKEAHEQGAYIFWNHPGWKGQQKDGIAKWYDEHTKLLNEGMLHGIEIVNDQEYYPLVHKWCVDKNITLIGNSDIHYPTAMAYDFSKGEHRAMTLVFAKEKSTEAVQEALMAKRTAVYFRDTLYGKKEFLTPIFEKSVMLKNSELSFENSSRINLQFNNSSDVTYKLELVKSNDEVSAPKHITLYAHRTNIISVKKKKDTTPKKIELIYKVTNLKTNFDSHLEHKFAFPVK